MPHAVDYLLTPPYFPFAVALALMLMLAALEVVGFGLTALAEGLNIDFDADADGEADIPGLHWLGLGRVPLGMLIVTWLFLFAVSGVALQRFTQATTGQLLPALTAGTIALVPMLVLGGFAAALLSRIIPQDETSAVSLSALVGRRATMLDIAATTTLPARARVRDVHGQTHYVSVLAHENTLLPDQEVLLVRREGTQFWATSPEQFNI